MEIETRYIFIVFVIFVILIYSSAFLSLKSKKARKLVAGDPTVIIKTEKF
jgi:uncharacterized membrane protein YcaP (DUF421 family)